MQRQSKAGQADKDQNRSLNFHHEHHALKPRSLSASFLLIFNYISVIIKFIITFAIIKVYNVYLFYRAKRSGGPGEASEGAEALREKAGAGQETGCQAG